MIFLFFQTDSFTEICEFQKDYTIWGHRKDLTYTTTKQECAINVHEEYPDATGAGWFSDYTCEAYFGNKLSTDEGYELWSCLFKGKKYIEYIYSW